MTEAEATTIVALFVAAYPQSAADQLTAELWINCLATVNYDEAREGAMQWIGTSPHFPVISEFNVLLRANRRRDEPQWALPPGNGIPASEGVPLAKRAVPR